jgi:hypothetical protein
MTLPVAPEGDVFGDVIDDRTAELALKLTLQAWIDAALSHQERRWLGILRPQDQSPYVTEQGQIDRPASWPTISKLRLELHDQLPAIVTRYLGLVPGARDPQGNFREVFRYEISVAVAGFDEDDARWLASLYMAAVRMLLRQNKTLGGFAETTVLGNVQPLAGVLEGVDQGGERAVYSCEAQIHVRSTVNENLGTPVPPDDPHDPDPPPPAPEEAEIVIEILEDTP